MKVQFFLPINGYRSEIAEARLANDFEGWIQRKFGSAIRREITDDFTMNIDGDSFIADFADDENAWSFLRTFGGRIVE